MNVSKARIAQEIVGGELFRGGLQKLLVKRERPGGGRPRERFEALFNPTEITFAKIASWRARRHLQHRTAIKQDFHKVRPETLTVELFFDTYEPRSDGLAWSKLLTSVAPKLLTSVAPTSFLRSVKSVREYTDKFAGLADYDRNLHRPPRCWLYWGNIMLFSGVLTSVKQQFTLFHEDGTPVRATLTCKFTEYSTRGREHRSADVHKTRQVRRADSLHSLAAEEYGDPAQWRHIARANGIVDPRALTPGTVLIIPKL